VSATGPQDGLEIGPYRAVNDLVPQFFETILPFSVQGLWDVQIVVSSDLGEESINVLFDVGPGGGINWIMVSVVVVVILASGIVIWDKLPVKKRQ
jgi:cytochrome b subunit of formate dehydrogenase